MNARPANRVLAALLSEHGRVVDTVVQAHVEKIDHTEHHDLHRLADDGCPHHLDPYYDHYNGEAVPAVVQKSNHGVHLPTDAKARKAVPLCTGVLDYFPKALAAIAEVSRIGNDQHNPGQPLHWAKGKSTDHADCALRHFAERGTIDTDGGRHTAKAGWRVLAELEMEIEAEEAGMSKADYIAHLKAREAA
jgi:hypothetical protein